MAQKTYYIYIPGLGDRFDLLRRLALRLWRRRDTRVVFVPMRWRDDRETYEQKYTRVAHELQRLDDERVVLVGESAGGAMALLIFSRHLKQVQGVVTICGYNYGASDIAPMYRSRNPAFYPLLRQTDVIVRELPRGVRQRIATIYSTQDRSVTAKHSQISGAHVATARTFGHFRSIGYILLKGRSRVIRWSEECFARRVV